MGRAFLSNIELYYTKAENISDDIAEINGNEAKHILKVMRHKENDILYITDGKGDIFSGPIISISTESVKINIHDRKSYLFFRATSRYF